MVTGTWVNNCYLLTQHLPWRNLRGPWSPGLLTPEKSAASDKYLQRWQNRENRYHRQPETSHSQFLFPLAVTVTAVPAQCWSTSLQSISIWQLAAPSITRPLTRLIQVIRSHSRLLILMFALPQQTASSLPSANCPWAWMKPLIWATLMNSGQNALPVIGDYRSDFLQQLYWSLYTSLEKQKESCWRLQFDMSLVVSKSLLSFARFSQEPTLHLKWIVRIAVERTLVAAGLNGIPVDCFDICWPDTQLFGHWSPVTLITSLMLYFSVTTLGFLVSSSTNCNKSVPRLLKK